MPINAIVGPSGNTIVNFDTSSSSDTSSSTSSTRPLPAAASTSSPAVISDGPAPNPSPSSSPSLTSSAATETTAAASSQVTASAQQQQAQGTPAGSIAGLVIGLLLLVGLLLFGVRWFFIRKREHKTTPARSRISRLNISGPSNFTHLQSGAAVGMAGTQITPGAGGANATNAQTTPSVHRSTATTDANAVAASPYDRIKQKYSFDLNQLETGLSDHMETMKTSRKNAPSH